MLSVNQKNRPTISTILEKPFIKKKVAAYIYDFIQIYKNDTNLEADEFQLAILKEQAEKLGVFNSIMKEISNFDDKMSKAELSNSTDRNEASYLKYLNKKQEEKKKIEEKIDELEKQKKLILRGGRGTGVRASKNLVSKNGSSVEKLKFKDSKIKRPESSIKKSIRKISHENEQGPTLDENRSSLMMDSKNYVTSNLEENKKLNKVLKDHYKVGVSSNIKPKLGAVVSKSNNSTISTVIIKNYESKEDDSADDLEIINEEKDENILPSERNKIMQLTQEIDKMREYLDKTQYKINKIEKKITFNTINKDTVVIDKDNENDLHLTESEEEIENNNKEINLNSIDQSQDDEIGKLIE
jgi:hypothetical protein